MVTLEAAAEPVLDQPRRAVRAFEAEAASPAERDRRIAAPIQEQERLLAAPESASATASTRTGDSHLPRSGGEARMSIAAMAGRPTAL